MPGWEIIALWGGFLILILGMLFLDLFVLHRNAHEIKMKEALIGTCIPVALALLFTAFVYYGYENHWLHLGVPQAGLTASQLSHFPTNGNDAALQYLTGYIIEISLSADNVFLFLVLMSFFAVKPALQHKVLFWGVLGALVMRAVMILAGAELIKQFGWLIYIFGAFLLFTGIKMLLSKDDEEKDPSQNIAIRLLRKIIPIHHGYVEDHFLTRINGRTYATTLLVVLVCIEFTDLVFALDSIPAIFGITYDPFIVFTSNVFAILGLRSMFFLLAGVMDKFHYLKIGLSFVLSFVGVKMLLPGAATVYAKVMGLATVPGWHISTLISLSVVLGALLFSIIASLIWPKPLPLHVEEK